MEAFGPIEHFGRFVSDDPATVFDPHPTPDSWRLDSTDERSSGNVHPRGPWEIKFERRNDSVSAFMVYVHPFLGIVSEADFVGSIDRL